MSSLIMEDWVPVEALKNRKELLHLHVTLENIEKINCIHGLFLFKGLELDLGGRLGRVNNWALDFVEIVSSHGGKHSSPADILMQLILEIDERVV